MDHLDERGELMGVVACDSFVRRVAPEPLA
jgi:hypothetical protein